jgi:hypothetical protein
LRSDDLFSFTTRDAHWFFNQNVLSRGKSGQSDFGMKGIGTGHEHGVYIAAGYQLPVVDGEGINVPKTSQRLQDERVHITERRDFIEISQLVQARPVQDLCCFSAADYSYSDFLSI